MNPLATPALQSASTHRLRRPRGSGSRSYYFERLLQLSIRHAFYNASEHLCPDFSIFPTAASGELMASLGLLYKYEGTGFSVLLDRSQQSRFLDYLRSQADTAGGSSSGAVWTRLSFILSVRSANFVNFTDMPINTSPALSTFYLSNMTAELRPDGGARLHSGRLTRPMETPLTGSQYCLWLPQIKDLDIQRVVVRDISGAEVMCQPVYWPRSNPAEPSCPPPPSEEDEDCVRRNPIYLDFAFLPEDKYQIAECVNSTGDCKPASECAVVYVFSATWPMFFIDLLFTNPGLSTGVYPVEDLWNAKPEITPVHYYLELNSRSTIWNYYIISTGAPLSDLKITTIAPRSPRPITFTGPSRVLLPNEQPAELFVSDSPIPLQQQSTYRFQLSGLAGGLGTRDGILMDNLPVASSGQVIPIWGNYATSSLDDSSGETASARLAMFSDIYVYV